MSVVKVGFVTLLISISWLTWPCLLMWPQHCTALPSQQQRCMDPWLSLKKLLMPNHFMGQHSGTWSLPKQVQLFARGWWGPSTPELYTLQWNLSGGLLFPSCWIHYHQTQHHHTPGQAIKTGLGRAHRDRESLVSAEWPSCGQWGPQPARTMRPTTVLSLLGS